ncbi:hypothetical protein C240_758 [Enterococcus sp. 5H]|nr:hypothetical protein [Enterococcus sp. 5H]
MTIKEAIKQTELVCFIASFALNRWDFNYYLLKELAKKR